MTTLLAIDPGHAGAGNACAQFGEGRLLGAWFDRAPEAADLGAAADRVIVERPEYQGRRSQNARPEDLMNLAWSGALLAGVYVGRGATLIEVAPSAWKGTEPKPQHHARLWEVLTPDERVILGGMATARAIADAVRKGALSRWGKPGALYYPRSFTTHNLLDAAALGCWHLGRLQKRG